MSYNPTTDFLALLRSTAGGVRSAEMPGLDFVISALGRAGLITLFVGQNAPTVNQTTTVWFQPALSSWAQEGVVFLWNAAAAAYQVATPVLWSALITGQIILVPNRTVVLAGGFATTIADANGSIGLNHAPGVGSTTLPANALAGQTYTYQDLAGNFSQGALTINAPGGHTIAGLPAVELNVNRQSATFTYYGNSIWGFE